MKNTMIAAYVLLTLTLMGSAQADCVFPFYFMHIPWYYKIAASKSVRTKVVFTNNDVTFIWQQLPSDYIIKSETYDCEEMAEMNKFILKSFDDDGIMVYKCLEVIERSKSIMQFRESKSQATKSPSLCNPENLVLDPWLVVSYNNIESDNSPCPLNAGYNMKIADGNGNDHGCNFMDLPMRFESDCLAGEGMVLNFRKHECTSFLSTEILQKTICVTHWVQGSFMFTIVRKHESGDIWCLRFPSRRLGKNVKVELFTDIICPDDSPSNHNIKFFTLYLEKIVQMELCADEYSQCSRKPCMSYIRDQCHKSCGKCMVDEPLPICSFPRRFRGEWYLGSSQTENINISESVMQIGSIGHFKCVAFADSPPSKERIYTTISLFENGCRPRYTCLDLKRISPSVIGFSISQSFVWPLNDDRPGESICSKERFEPDDEPIGDRYRSFPNAAKPILPVSRSLVPTPCHLKSVHNYYAQIKSGTGCRGRMYQDCKNSSLIRMEFNRCRTQQEPLNFMCVATFKGRYWEKLLILVNLNNLYDSKCLAFTSLKPMEALMLHSSQCDMYAWSYYDSSIRSAYMHFQLEPKDETCMDIPFPTTTALPAISEANKMVDDTSLSDKKLPNPSLMRDGVPTPIYNIPSKSGDSKPSSKNTGGLNKGEVISDSENNAPRYLMSAYSLLVSLSVSVFVLIIRYGDEGF
ncbi:uncharacterized protein LOC110463832 [Mizuhopecten yessoensis]|uniref:DUF7043 domain-containing protein n=1 Tax=Mizuhopecten yessoensis TaxID=6573 RepID=A0A210PV85_MIZYE|nr:uncharacterized protein LOC110463832 [Mizuhopecten yessoensis]XP_021374392.1 uncharacterized protein LOC110463832 [Mizuhopecten yessoensis]OWF40408.1 hypothetical protein KP79_PYT16141 [Mizuhopecten yessoensis]